MSIHAIAWAYSVDAPLTSTEAFVLVTLAEYADDEGGRCYPSMNTLARKCRVSRSTVIRILDRLEHVHGLVRKTTSGAGKGRSNYYRLMVQDPRLPRMVPEGSPMDPYVREVNPRLWEDRSERNRRERSRVRGVSPVEHPSNPQGVSSVTQGGVSSVEHPSDGGCVTGDTGVYQALTQGGVPPGDTQSVNYPLGTIARACAGNHLDRSGELVQCSPFIADCTAFRLDEVTRARGTENIARLKARLASRATDTVDAPASDARDSAGSGREA